MDDYAGVSGPCSWRRAVPHAHRRTATRRSERQPWRPYRVAPATLHRRLPVGGAVGSVSDAQSLTTLRVLGQARASVPRELHSGATMNQNPRDPPRTAAAGPDIYRASLVIDGLVVAPPSGRVVRDLLAAGITGCNWTVASHSDETLTAINKIVQFYWLLEQFADCTLLVERADDLSRAKRERKLGIILGFQSGSPLGRNPHLVRVFHRLGVRIMQLTYNEGNALAAGCLEASNGGLTSLGVQAVQEMNRTGMVIDLSHVGARASLEAIELSQATDIFMDPTDGVWWRAVTGRLYPEVSQGMTYATHNIAGFMHQSELPAVAEAMLRRGYDEHTVGKVLGENWRRVYSQVWSAQEAGTPAV